MTVRADRGSLLRGLPRAAIVPAAAMLVHQLRFMLAFGSGAGAELARQGHAYLHSLIPWIVMLIGVAAGAFLWSLGRALHGHRSASRYTISLAALWLACAAALIAIFAVQEFLEGLFATGHAAGLVGIFGFGGWWSIPAALCVGLVLAVVFHGARWVLDELAERLHGPSRARRPRGRSRSRALDLRLPRLSPLAEGRSGRGPPR